MSSRPFSAVLSSSCHGVRCSECWSRCSAGEQLRRCSACKCAFYDSTSCQRTHWKSGLMPLGLLPCAPTPRNFVVSPLWHRHPRCLVESGQWGLGRDSCCTAATPHSDWHLTGSCALTCRRSLPSCRSFRHACATVSCGICCCRAGVTYGTACRVGYHAAWQTAAADEVLLLIHTVVAALQGVASLSPVQRRVLRVTLCLLHAVRCMAHVATCNTHVARALLRQ
jgi:hypothetical protein